MENVDGWVDEGSGAVEAPPSLSRSCDGRRTHVSFEALGLLVALRPSR